MSVRLGTDEHLFESDQIVTATENGRVVGRKRIEPAEQPTLVVPLRPDAHGNCTVTFTAAKLRRPGSGRHAPARRPLLSFDYRR